MKVHCQRVLRLAILQVHARIIDLFVLSLLKKVEKKRAFIWIRWHTYLCFDQIIQGTRLYHHAQNSNKILLKKITRIRLLKKGGCCNDIFPAKRLLVEIDVTGT